MEKLEKYTVLTPQDVMDVLGIGKDSAYELLNSGGLKGFRVGRSWRVSAEALEEFMYRNQH
ncbi:MAG: helix-turn-helix domain-containing protein [Oscillospiraceae bacterium]|nr:helix-turn-helix domain-containing protein [Oscillospiraceae bacterium]